MPLRVSTAAFLNVAGVRFVSSFPERFADFLRLFASYQYLHLHRSLESESSLPVSRYLASFLARNASQWAIVSRPCLCLCLDSFVHCLSERLVLFALSVTALFSVRTALARCIHTFYQTAHNTPQIALFCPARKSVLRVSLSHHGTASSAWGN